MGKARQDWDFLQSYWGRFWGVGRAWLSKWQAAPQVCFWRGWRRLHRSPAPGHTRTSAHLCLAKHASAGQQHSSKNVFFLFCFSLQLDHYPSVSKSLPSSSDTIFNSPKSLFLGKVIGKNPVLGICVCVKDTLCTAMTLDDVAYLKVTRCIPLPGVGRERLHRTKLCVVQQRKG